MTQDLSVIIMWQQNEDAAIINTITEEEEFVRVKKDMFTDQLNIHTKTQYKILTSHKRTIILTRIEE